MQHYCRNTLTKIVYRYLSTGTVVGTNMFEYVQYSRDSTGTVVTGEWRVESTVPGTVVLLLEGTCLHRQAKAMRPR